MRAVLKIKAASSAFFQGQICMQLAGVRTDEPGTPSTKGTQRTGNGEWCETVDLTNDTPSKFFVRFGVAYNYQAGQAQSEADVDLEVTYSQCGEISGAATYQLPTTTTTAQFIAITGFLPAQLVEKIKAAVICNSVTGNVQWRIAYRTATTSKDAPGAWTALTDANAPYGAGEVDTGDLPFTNTGVMWMRIGIQYWATSGQAQGTIAAAIATRRS
jgi:hypothetical protein